MSERNLESINAFIIVNGSKIYPLKSKIINVGRMIDNDIVVSDLHVSRFHAQLRFENGRFILIDMQSTGGTSINGTRIKKAPLYPGDVISLAGVPFLYGENAIGYRPDNVPPVNNRTTRSSHPTIKNTQAVDRTKSDNFLDFFDFDEE